MENETELNNKFIGVPQQESDKQKTNKELVNQSDSNQQWKRDELLSQYLKSDPFCSYWLGY